MATLGRLVHRVWMPATRRPRPQHIAAFLAERFDAGLAASTVAVDRAAIRAAHVDAGELDPTDHEGVRRTLSGLRRERPAPSAQVEGLTAEVLATVAAHVPPGDRDPGAPEFASRKRGRALTGTAVREVILRAVGRAASAGASAATHPASARPVTSSPAVMVAGRWQSPAMPARYARSEEAARGAVATYLEPGQMSSAPRIEDVREHGTRNDAGV